MDKSVELYLEEINKVPDLTNEEELDVISRVLNDDHEAADRLAEANMKQVAALAMKYREEYKEMDLLDLIQAGNTGLLRAVQSYTPGDYRFWEYAAWWVRKEIEEFIKNPEDHN